MCVIGNIRLIYAKFSTEVFPDALSRLVPPRSYSDRRFHAVFRRPSMPAVPRTRAGMQIRRRAPHARTQQAETPTHLTRRVAAASGHGGKKTRRRAFTFKLPPVPRRGMHMAYSTVKTDHRSRLVAVRNSSWSHQFPQQQKAVGQVSKEQQFWKHYEIPYCSLTNECVLPSSA